MPEETIALTQRALHRLKVVEAVTDRRLTPAEAGGQLGITARQVKRLVAAYRAEGAAGLVSQRLGQPSNRRLKEPLRGAIRALLVERYPDFGPTLAQEKLLEVHQIEVSIETVRQLQVELGLWKPKRRKGARAFQLRERRGRFGELIQIDGSPHAWFEGRGPCCTLIVFIDDATGRLLQLWFAPSETTAVYLFVLRRHLEQYGRPVALYSDRHSIFRINQVEPANGATTTQFGRALAGLEIEAIHARTPQAKGRVERANQTLQDRLVKELRLRGLSDLASANAYLPAFMADFNARFAVTPSSAEDAHRPLLHSPRALDLLLAEQEERTLSKNLIVQYRNIAYQIRHDGPGYRLRGAKVTVCDLANGEVVLLREGRELPYTTYRKGERPAPVEDEKTLNERVDAALEKQQRQRAKPAPDHPWRQAMASSLSDFPAAAWQASRYNGAINFDGSVPMSNFRAITRDIGFLLPPSVQDWLPEGHLARYVVEVVEGLDLSELERAYGGRGSAAYHPALLLSLLIYGYATGCYSSRKIERATHDSLAFRYIACNDHPDHDTLATFRRRFNKEFEAVFVSVLQVARENQLSRFGSVSLDGTKIHANASRHSALSYGHTEAIEAQLKVEVQQLLALAEAADGANVPDGMSVPEELKRREDRLAAIAAAKAKIEARAAERFAREQVDYEAKLAAREQRVTTTGKNPGGKPPKAPEAGPRPKDQINLTDEESRIMPVAGGGFEQCYNAQASVDNQTMLVLVPQVTQAVNDKQQVAPMLERLQALPAGLNQTEQVVADTGYFSADNVVACEQAGIEPLIAVKRDHHHPHWAERFSEPAELPANPTPVERMTHRLKTGAGRTAYALRKQRVEPVFGIIKSVMGFRQFLTRGLDNVQGEWTLVCLAWNLKRMAVLRLK